MRIIAVDDEKIALEGLLREIAEVEPNAELNGFRNGADALGFAAENGGADVAFLDIDMTGMNGVTLAKELLKLYPSINIIFTTGYSRYALEAIDIRCSGYILKPITEKKIRHELENLRNPIGKEKRAKLYARTFGKFELFANGEPVGFRYKRTKELFAYLIDRRGAFCSIGEVIGALWEGEKDENKHISYLKNMRADLMTTLEALGCEDCIVRGRGEIAVLPDKIECDYYEYLANKDLEGAGRLFRGEYMSQYSWSELTLGSLIGDLSQWS